HRNHRVPALPASYRLADDFPHRRRRTLLSGDNWSLEAAERHGHLFIILDEAPDLDQPDLAPRIVVYEFGSRRLRAQWVARRLETWAAQDLGPLLREQLATSRRWVAIEIE
ncbi:MAG: hypothetical protein QOF76_4414, partial [Solirubrobacteraceae bacterium]|nr:hypothetical protein [Solirubrobacteraceae bacterium]